MEAVTFKICNNMYGIWAPTNQNRCQPQRITILDTSLKTLNQIKEKNNIKVFFLSPSSMRRIYF